MGAQDSLQRSRTARWPHVIGFLLVAGTVPGWLANPAFAKAASQEATPSRASIVSDLQSPSQELDQFGRPVFDEHGTRRLYEGPETEALEEQWSLLRDERDGEKRPGTVGEISNRIEHGSLRSKAAIPTVKGTETWHYVNFGVGIGDSGLALARLDGSGSPSHVVAGAGVQNFESNRYWYVLKEATGSFDFTWQSDLYDEELDSLTVADVDADGVDEVLVGTDGRVEIWAFIPGMPGVSGNMERVSMFYTGASAVQGLTVGNVDLDSSPEILFCDDGAELLIYSLAGSAEFRSSSFGCSDVAVGQVDDDASPEIVVTNGSTGGWVLDGPTRALEWSRAGGLGDQVTVADLDGDSRDEIIAGFRWNDLYVFDAETQSIAWIEDVSGELGPVIAADWDVDGAIEIIYGDAQWGSLRVLSGLDGTTEGTINNPGHGVTGIAVGGLRAGGYQQVLWGTGFSSTASDHLQLFDTETSSLDVVTPSFVGPFYGLAHGVAGGVQEIVYSSFNTDAFEDPRYYQRDANTFELTHASPEPTGSLFQDMHRLATADLDGDGTFEVIVGVDRSYNAKLQAYDGETHALKWQTDEFSGHVFQGIQVADVDGDGALEVVASARKGTSAAPGSQVFVFAAADGAMEWQSPVLTTGFQHASHLRLGDVDSDGAMEIVVAIDDGNLWIFDGQTQIEELETSGERITALELADRDANGVQELIVGDKDGALWVIDPVTGGSVESILESSFGPIRGLQVHDLDLDGVLDYAFVNRERLQVRSGLDASELWIYWGPSPIYSSSDGPLGDRDSLLVADLDSDPAPELWLNLGPHGMKMFDLTPVSNSAPTLSAIMPADATVVDGPEVTLTASAADGEDGDLSSSIVWALLSKSQMLGWGPSVTAKLDAGDHTLAAFVSDSSGAAAFQVFTLTVSPGNAEPSVWITAPEAGSIVDTGSLTLTAGATDVEDGDLTAQIQWSSSIDGPLGSGGSVLSALSLGEHVLSVSVTDSAGQTVSTNLSLTVAPQAVPGLMAYWAFDDGAGTTALDSSFQGRDGVLELGGQWGDGRVQGGLELDGTDDLIRVAADPELDELSAFTVAGWIRHPATQTFRSIVDKRDGHKDGFDLYLNASSRLFIRVNNASLNGSATVADGDWHHVVGTYDGTELKLFVDGVLDGSLSAVAGPSSTSSDLLIGHNWSSGYLFGGSVDDLRLYDRALDGGEVQAIFDAPSPLRFDAGPSGVLAVGTTEAVLELSTDEAADCAFSTVPGTEFGAMSNTFETIDGLDHTATVDGLQDSTAYTFFVRCSDLAGHSNIEDSEISFEIAEPGDLTLALLGHWQFNDNGDDSSGNGHHGVLQNGGQWVPGLFSSALSFDGFETGVRVTSTAVLASPAVISISAWIQVQPEDSGSWMAIVDKRDGNIDGYDLFLNNDSKLFLRINDQSHTGLSNLADGDWHHVMGTYDGSEIALWVDGVLETTKTVGNEVLDTASLLRIGEHWSFGPYYFDGLIDEVRLYNRVLGAPEAQTLATLPTP